MKPLKVRLAAAILAGLAGVASAAAPSTTTVWPWHRELQFARGLWPRQYYDLAEVVIARLVTRTEKRGDTPPDIIGIEAAELFKEIADYYSDLAENVAGEKEGIRHFIQYLDTARQYFIRYVKHSSVEKNPKLAGERFQSRLTISRITLGIAEGHARYLEDAQTVKADKDKHQADALRLFKEGIDEFQRAVADKDAEFARNKSDPTDEARKARPQIRWEDFLVHLEYNNARVRFARFLKAVKAPEGEWKAQLDAAEKDYRKMLLDFAGYPATPQANLYLVQCLQEYGPDRDKECLERLEDVWAKRGEFSTAKRTPCEAVLLRASILFRQKKYAEVVPPIDELLKFISGDNWKPEQKTTDDVAQLLGELEGAEAQQFDQRAASRVILMMAEAYGNLGAEAEKAAKPAKDIRALYGTAYDLAVGVAHVRKVLEPKYADLLETWRRKGGRPRDPLATFQLYVKELREAADLKGKEKLDKYYQAAELYRDLTSQQMLTNAPRDQVRDAWMQVGKCYFAAEHCYEAGIVFTAVGNWFPNLKPVDAYGAALQAFRKQAERTKGKFDEGLVKRAELEVARANPLGEGGVFVQQGVEARKAGKLDEALALFKNVRPDQAAYPRALFEIAVTHRTRFDALPDDQRMGAAGKRIATDMFPAFQKVLDLYTERIPQLQGDENAEARARVLDVVARALAMLTDICLREPYTDLQRVLRLTADVEKTYPGIKDAPAFPVIAFNRMRAAYALVRQADAAHGAEQLPVVEETWKTIQQFPNFQYMNNACAYAAQSYTEVARKLEEEAKKLAETARKPLLDRAKVARDRGIDLYIELVTIQPRQPITVYRSILHNLRTREHEPKSADYRKVAEIAPKAIELFERDPQCANDILLFKATIGIACHALGRYSDAIPPLEDVDSTWEDRFQKAFGKYKERQKLWEQEPRRYKKPEMPRRDPMHPEVKEKLAFCYLASNATQKYKRALEAYVTLLRLYPEGSPQQWVVLYNLCETARRLGQYREVVNQISRALERGIPDKTVKSMFRDLAVRLSGDVDKITDPKLKGELAPIIKSTIEKLRQ